MKKNELYQYPTSTRSEFEGKRLYEIVGHRLPSVTTILSTTKPKETEESLQRWREKVGLQRSREIVEKSAARGTSLHKYLEMYILEQGYRDLTDVGQEAEKMSKIIIDKGLKNVTEYYGTECTLYYPGLYAGTTDFICMHNGDMAVVDFKQTNKPKRREWIDDYFMQLGAYGMAHDYVYKTAIKKGVIMMVNPDGYYQEFIIEGPEFRNYKHKFIKRVNEYYDDYVFSKD